MNTISKLLRAPLLRRFRLQSSRRFWRCKGAVERLQFLMRRRTYALKTGGHSVRQNSWIFWDLLRGTGGKIVASILVVALLMLLERVFPTLAASQWLKANDNAAYGLLGTLAQVSATMLGLYFTAVSLVASTTYARVSGEIRAMVVEEQVGSFYFGFLAYFAATSVALFAAVSMGLPAGVLCLAWISFIALMGVFSFVVLGTRTFSFFDPASLVVHLNDRARRALRQVTPVGHKWNDPSFQNHHQRQAAQVIAAYSDLVVIAQRDEHLNSNALIDLGLGLLSLLGTHAAAKSQIPSESLWFRRAPSHKRWLTAPFAELEIARATDTALAPEMVPDVLWLERASGVVLGRIGESLARRDDLSGLLRLLTAAVNYALKAATNGCVSESMEMMDRLSERVDKVFDKAVPDTSSTEAVRRDLSRVAAEDLTATGYLNAFLGVVRMLRSHTSAGLARHVSRIDWSRPESLYSVVHPRDALRRMEKLRAKLVFEIEVEGKIQTPEWLMAEMGGLGYAEFMEGHLEPLLSRFERRFGERCSSAVKSGDAVGAASVLCRGMEATNKLQAHLPQFKEWWDSVMKLNRSQDEQWPAIDWQAIDQRVLTLRHGIERRLAACIGGLAKTPQENQMPDLFGHAYSILADGCFDALLHGDSRLFEELFPPFFGSALLGHDLVRATLGELNRFTLQIALGPLSDLVAVSGYAELYTDLHQKEFRAPCRKVWDSYLAGLPDDAARHKFFAALALLVEPAFGTSPREMLRHRWKVATSDLLISLGLQDRGHLGDFGMHPTPDHPCALVRAFASLGGFLSDGEAVFLATYVFGRPESIGVTMPHQVREFQRAIRREISDTDEEGDDEEE